MITPQLLDTIEQHYGVTILYCCESGSRAWGFPSQDSDYDARFVYIGDASRYVSIREFKDVIEYSNDGILDVNGWDIRKALRLFYNSNSTLYEWLQSPIVYREHAEFTDPIRRLIPEYFAPRAGIFHYLGLSKGIYPQDIEKDDVRLKKYFYVLRTLLAAKWIVEYRACPPMQFSTLLTLVTDEEIVSIIGELLVLKSNGTESTTVPAIPILNTFISNLYNECYDAVQHIPKYVNDDVAPLDELFRTMLERKGGL